MVNTAWSERPMPDASESGARAAVSLSKDEALQLLPAYVEGMLPSAVKREVERHIASDPECALELSKLRQEEELLTEALSDLKPDQSFRSRVSGMCADVRRQAEKVANSIPEKTWAVFRWTMAVLALAYFTAVALVLERPTQTEAMDNWTSFFDRHSPMYWVNVTLFVLSLFLLIGGRLVAAFESRISGMMRGQSTDGKADDKYIPGVSRLEVLTLELLGICGVLATSVFHYFSLMA